MRLNTEDGGNYRPKGDMILLAWLAEAARGSAEPISFYASRKRHYNLLTMLGQDVSDDPTTPSVFLGNGYYVAEIKERGARMRVDYVREDLGIKTGYKRPRVHLAGEELDWARQTRRQLGGEPLVLLFPQTDFFMRSWPAVYWIELSWLLEQQGARVAVMLRDEDQLYTNNVPSLFVGCSLMKVAALMSLAAMVVGNDSGAAHLSGTIGIPVLALVGSSRPYCAFGHIPDVIPLSSEEPPGCAGCHYGTPYRAACDLACQSLYSLWPRVVLRRILTLLERSGEGHATRH
jgi:hypothetical protein